MTQEENLISDEKYKLCEKCNFNDEQKDHVCPYGIELYDDDTLCNCCDKCTGDCADDI